MSKRFSKIAFMNGPNPAAQAALEVLKTRYEHVPIEDADVLVTLGGDDRTAHKWRAVQRDRL